MNTFELSKIAGAVLFCALLIFVIGQFTGFLVAPAALDKIAYPVPETEETVAETTEAATEAATESTTESTAAAVASLGGLLAAADAEKGRKFARRCAACHSFDEGGSNKIGPNLWGILANQRAKIDGFAYSSAMAELDGAWGYAELDGFLAKPKEYLPGTKMAFAGVKKATDRADLILYLRSLGDEALALPPSE
jgi:cytochrome c